MRLPWTRGFTLLELMIAVAIIGILAAIAYPNYEEQVRKSRRAECTVALAGLASAMERHYTANGFSYEGAATGGGNTGSPAVYSTTCPSGGGPISYNLTITASSASTYSLSATPTGPQTGDRCGTLTLNEMGVRGVTGAAADAASCW